jgi:hypothetical protein
VKQMRAGTHASKEVFKIMQLCVLDRECETSHCEPEEMAPIARDQPRCVYHQFTRQTPEGQVPGKGLKCVWSGNVVALVNLCTHCQLLLPFCTCCQFMLPNEALCPKV